MMVTIVMVCPLRRINPIRSFCLILHMATRNHQSGTESCTAAKRLLGWSLG